LPTWKIDVLHVVARMIEHLAGTALDLLEIGLERCEIIRAQKAE
jgi:hypothetical protein